MRKNSLMIAAAVAALTTSMAFAQSPTTPPTQSGPSAGTAGSVNGSGAVKSGGSADTGKSLGAAGGATTGAGATTETNKADDFKTNQKQKGAAENKSAPMQKGAQQDKASPSNNRMGQSDKPAAKSETTGQAPAERSGTSTPKSSSDQMKSGSERNAAPTGQSGQTGQSRELNQNSQDNTRSGQPGARSSEGRSSTTNVNVNLSTEQRTRIKEVVVKDRSAPRVASVNFSLSVGTAIPRTVKHVVVPTMIVSIEPAWRGFHYFMVGDQIVIVDPNTLEIVAVIDA